jgi:hypothetical protein
MLKSVFKSAAISVLKMKKHPLRTAYDKTTEGGTKPNLATLTLARRIAAASLGPRERLGGDLRCAIQALERTELRSEQDAVEHFRARPVSLGGEDDAAGSDADE